MINDDDPYVETIERLKMKSKSLYESRQFIQQNLGELIHDYHSLKHELKRHYQKHYKELDQYLRYRIRTKQLQDRIISTDESIQYYRQQYQNTLDRLNTLSNRIHQNRND
ncbi:hypothetical protein BLA29_013435, partial [Euroglyphus maynei]